MRARRAVVARAGARRARLAGAPQPPPLRRLLRARRDRHAVRRRGRVLELQERPGRRAQPGPVQRGRRLRVHVRQADRRAARGAPTAGWSGSRSAPQLRVRKNGGKPKPLRTSKDYFPSQDPTLGPVSRFFDGESTTEVGLDASLRNDIWAAVAPDIAKLRPRIEEGDRLFDKAADDLTAEQSNEFLALALRGLTDRYAQNPPPARFRFEVNPMVTWIWIGGLIVLLGGFIAGWPTQARDDAHRQRPLRRPRRARRARARARPGLGRHGVRADPARGRGRRAARHRPAARRARARATSRSRPSWPSSRPPRRPSTARSATPSSTTGRASSPTPTGARWTARCAPRPSSYSNGWIVFRSGPSRYPKSPHAPHDSQRPSGRRSPSA